MAPIVDGLKKKYKGSVEITSMNTDTSKEAAEIMGAFNLQYIPSYVAVNAKGEVVQTWEGTKTEKELSDILEQLK